MRLFSIRPHTFGRHFFIVNPKSKDLEFHLTSTDWTILTLSQLEDHQHFQVFLYHRNIALYTQKNCAKKKESQSELKGIWLFHLRMDSGQSLPLSAWELDKTRRKWNNIIKENITWNFLSDFQLQSFYYLHLQIMHLRFRKERYELPWQPCQIHLILRWPPKDRRTMPVGNCIIHWYGWMTMGKLSRRLQRHGKFPKTKPSLPLTWEKALLSIMENNLMLIQLFFHGIAENRIKCNGAKNGCWFRSGRILFFKPFNVLK